MLDSLIHTELVWIDQPQKLRDISKELSAQDILAVDTESNSLYAYQEQVCLIQFSTREKDFLVDTLALPDLSPLEPIFKSERIMKVFHAAEYDLICLHRDYGFKFNFLFDTMIAARTLGYQNIGLGSLLEKYFHIHVEKKYQRANWGRRPLKEDMLEYARLDSHYLIPLAEILQKELRECGRWELAREDFERSTQTLRIQLNPAWMISGNCTGLVISAPNKQLSLNPFINIENPRLKDKIVPHSKSSAIKRWSTLLNKPRKTWSHCLIHPLSTNVWSNVMGKD